GASSRCRAGQCAARLLPSWSGTVPDLSLAGREARRSPTGATTTGPAGPSLACNRLHVKWGGRRLELFTSRSARRTGPAGRDLVAPRGAPASPGKGAPWTP